MLLETERNACIAAGQFANHVQRKMSTDIRV